RCRRSSPPAGQRRRSRRRSSAAGRRTRPGRPSPPRPGRVSSPSRRPRRPRLGRRSEPGERGGASHAHATDPAGGFPTGGAPGPGPAAPAGRGRQVSVASAPVVLAVDAGSTTAKTQFFDAGGRALAPVVRSRVAIAADGTADPAAFLASVEAAVDEALRRWTAPVDAVALSCAWHGLVGLGADGRPTTPLTTWSATGPAVVAAAVELRRRLGGADADGDGPQAAGAPRAPNGPGGGGLLVAVRRRTGAPVHPSFPAARLLAEGGRDPAAFAATVRWCSIGELLEGRWLAGAPGPSSSMASASGLFDQEARTWDADVLEAVGLRPATLADVDDRPRRGLAAGYRDRWPALAGAVWWPALGDGACAVVGTGCDVPAVAGRRVRASLTVGTSAAVRVLAGPAERAARPAGLFAYLLDADRVVLGAARSNAGNLVEWLSDVLRFGEGGDPVA